MMTTVTIVISGLLCLLLNMCPNLDIYCSKLLYSNYIYNHWVLKIIFNSVSFAVIINYIGCIILFYHNKFKFNKVLIYLITAGLLGPGLIVNGFLKEYIGRARPKEIIEFCGTKKFTKLFMSSNECITNCSFPSGHAAFAYYLTAWSALFYSKRRAVIVLFIIYGSVVGIGRVMQGGHFISDVVAACFIILSVNKLLFNFFKPSDNQIIAPLPN